jgi:DNA-binding FadR family transcriptional regulator
VTSGPLATPPRGAVRPLSLAELVADSLREQIVGGELADGDVLPKQEDLIAEFGVSKPSLREALRILEAEGLVQVRRGKFGGAVVRRPRVGNAAATIELVLRSMDASSSDVVQALQGIEPVCAGLCARRPDRATEVVPRLREVHDRALAALDDLRSYTTLARRFHEELVATCGNQTMILLMGALETICSADSALWIDRLLTEEAGAIPIDDAEYRRVGLEDHAEVLACIDAGDVEGAETAARRHVHARGNWGATS